jgi:hypothetical protein
MIFNLNRSIQYLMVPFLFVFLSVNISLQAKDKVPVKAMYTVNDTLKLEAAISKR